MLKLIEYNYASTFPRKRKLNLYMCNCGNTKLAESYEVKSGHIKSCGCLLAKILVNRNKTHGLSYLPEYETWLAMKARCYNINNPHYKDWGGRGIKVCQRWLGSFQNFYADMGPRPSDKHSLDRKDNDGPYSPDNCRWATKKEQASNRRKAKSGFIKIKYKDFELPLQDWAKIKNINANTLYGRIYRYKLPVDKAMSKRAGNEHE